MAKKVLMIDDDPEFVEAITNLLDAKGYDMSSAHDSVEGLKLAREINPDLILLDVMMTTAQEGFDTARDISQDDMLKDIPVVMMTGVRREMNLPFAFESNTEWLPVKVVLEKPVKPEVLLNAVAEHIR